MLVYRTTALNCQASIVVTATLLLLLGAVSANAQVALPSVEAVGQQLTREQALNRVSDAEVEAYRSRTGTSAAFARRSLAVQRQVPDLESRLRAKLLRRLTQLTFDRRAGEFVVRVPEVAQVDDLSGIMGRLRLEDAYRIERVSYTRAEMDNARLQIDADLRALKLSSSAATEEREGGLRVNVYDDSAMQRTQDVVAQAKLTDKVPVEVVESPARPEPALRCVFPDCDGVAGGISYSWNGAQHSCTHGFWVGSTGTPRPLMLTAGHCTYGRPWAPMWVFELNGRAPAQIGSQIPFLAYDAGGDAGLMQVLTNRRMSGGWMNWSTNGYSQLRSYFASPLGIGYAVCRHGGRAGLSQGDACGIIDAVNVAAPYPASGLLPATRVEGLIGVDAGLCPKAGDSGSPVTWANAETAVGILSGGFNTDPNSPVCGRGLVEPIGRALSRLGIFIYGSPAN